MDWKDKVVGTILTLTLSSPLLAGLHHKRVTEFPQIRYIEAGESPHLHLSAYENKVLAETTAAIMASAPSGGSFVVRLSIS